MTRSLSGTLWDICVDCMTLNGSALLFAYAAFVLYVGMANEKKEAGVHFEHGMADMPASSIPTVSVQTMLLQGISALLTPRKFVHIIGLVAKKIDNITGTSKNSFIINVRNYFLFYYMVVSGPAGIMVPENYSVKYNLTSITALLLMMLTNAVGDIISFKITIANVKKLNALLPRVVSLNGVNSFKDSAKTEIALYATTLIDTIIAFAVCFAVLVLTAIYFGASIGEYKFEVSLITAEGAINRALGFWDTVLEPYVISATMTDITHRGLPMLLLYSITSFIPTILLALFSIIWTILMPIRLILFSTLGRYKKIMISEGIVFAFCLGFFYVNSIVGSLSG